MSDLSDVQFRANTSSLKKLSGHYSSISNKRKLFIAALLKAISFVFKTFLNFSFACFSFADRNR